MNSCGITARNSYEIPICEKIPCGNQSADMLCSVAFDPFRIAVDYQFSDALSELEGLVAEQMIAGYTLRESLAHLGVTQKEYLQARNAVRERVLKYLV